MGVKWSGSKEVPWIEQSLHSVEVRFSYYYITFYVWFLESIAWHPHRLRQRQNRKVIPVLYQHQRQESWEQNDSWFEIFQISSVRLGTTLHGFGLDLIPIRNRLELLWLDLIPMRNHLELLLPQLLVRLQKFRHSMFSLFDYLNFVKAVGWYSVKDGDHPDAIPSHRHRSSSSQVK